ncbi:hypothetical protein GYMLUDRAFT_41760 [Collybiopsis luxurians FD-317 M1]|uniref:Mitochondrial distribution and morphology protein 12 n=1 Tax=Collybiopsis luxurians FD-317 M1 TaxID=944289 RepID=A0A0D0CJE3_9AGAR|nr:hypothetical protein GYMLUDRAFT_41760 [Collybiopsis luxurians FD-317 M1]
MSIELDWTLLNPALSDTLVSLLNNTLSNTTRPSFIGPVEVVSIEFGERAPEVELVGMRDIYRDFLDDDGEEGHEIPSEELEGNLGRVIMHGREATEDDVDGFEWVSRRAARREEGLASLQQRPMNMFASTPALPTLNGLHSPLTPNSLHSPLNMYSPLHNSLHPALHRAHTPSHLHLHETRDILNHRPSYSYSSGANSPFRRPLSSSSLPIPPNTALPTIPMGPPSPSGSDQSLDDEPHPLEHRQSSSPDESQSSSDLPPPPANPHPNLQLHFHISWHSDLRITLTTSLLINYPSPGFMSLPIKLSVTGLVFEGEVVVGYEGDPSSSGRKNKRGKDGKDEEEEPNGTERRIHLCVLDELDPYGPKVDRPKRDSFASDSPPLTQDHGDPPLSSSTTLTPPKDDSDPLALSPPSPPRPHHYPSNKPLPIGIRLLPSIFIESEIGQADKHALKNVNRVERFIQDVIRKTVEEELVFPNFCTIVLAGGE